MTNASLTMDSSASTAWRQPLFLLLAVWCVILALYWPTASAMAAIWWRSDTYAHGLIVPPAALWLIWRKRSQLASLSPKPAGLAICLMLGVGVLWLLGDLVAVNVVTQFALIALIVLAVPSVLGWAVARAVAFPLAFLFLAVPAGDFMMPQLMEWTADFTVAALKASGIPVYREGLHFIIPSGSWSVVQACSGIRYLMASVTVGCLFAYLNYRSVAKRLAFIGVAIAVPLVANWLRAYLIVMLGHFSGNELATGVDHLVYGWVFFGLVITAMFMIGARWADREVADLEPQRLALSGETLNRPVVTLMAVLAVLAVAVPHVLNWRLQGQVSKAPVAVQGVSSQAGWQPVSPPAAWVPAFEAANAMPHLAWMNARGEVVGLHVAYYRDQNYERKLVSSSNVLVKSEDEAWAQVSGARVIQADVDGHAVDVQRAQLRAQGAALTQDAARLVAWQFFWVDGRITSSPTKAKLLGAWQKLKGQGDDGAIVVIYTPGQGDAGDAVLRDFARDQGPAVLTALRATQSRQ